MVDQARQWSEVVEGTTSCGGWSPEVRARRVLVTELACALRIPERTAETLISDSEALLTHLPDTFAALSAGTISWRHAHVLVDHATSLESEQVADFEAAALPLATSLTVAKFDRKARAARERMHPESIDTRHVQATESRSIDLQPARDGMAWPG